MKTNIMKYLVIHTTDSPFDREITPDDLYKWHLGPRKNSDGTFTFKGVVYTKEQLKGKKLTLPSGIVVNAIDIQGNGWKQVGYSDLIQRSGQLVNLVPYNDNNVIDSAEVTNGAAGYNSISRHVALAGGWTQDKTIKNGKNPKTGEYLLPEELYTEKQLETLKRYIIAQKSLVPDVIVVGHNQLSQKTCPKFDVKKFLTSSRFLVRPLKPKTINKINLEQK